jgi:hypothetical protein
VDVVFVFFDLFFCDMVREYGCGVFFEKITKSSDGLFCGGLFFVRISIRIKGYEKNGFVIIGYFF